MEQNNYAFTIYNYEEIIGRILSITSVFEGPSLFPTEINFKATNISDPPTIEAKVFNYRRDARTETIFECYIDQNTTLEAFTKALDELKEVADRIIKTISENIPYEQMLDIERTGQEQQESDLPF